MSAAVRAMSPMAGISTAGPTRLRATNQASNTRPAQVRTSSGASAASQNVRPGSGDQPAAGTA